MNLNQLVYASEINRLGSFSRAAQTLFISQSALSKSIHALELELRQEIFIRTTDGVTITDFGKMFLSEAEKALQHITKIKNMAMLSKNESGAGPLKFSASCGQMLFAGEIFAGLMYRFLDVETDFRFRQRSYSEVYTDVRDGVSDVGVLMTLNTYTEDACRMFERNGLEYHTLGRLNVGVALHKNNPMAQAGVTRLKKGMLSDQLLIMIEEKLDPFSREREEINAAFGNPRTVYVADNDTALNLSGQVPAFFCVAQSNKIYSKLNMSLTLQIYPYQNVNLKYEFGWIKPKKMELTTVEKLFVGEITRLFR